MTIGEKILKLRCSLDISQEQLAEKINVSRQSVSKWEMDQALPQIDKVLQLCELFDVTTDELLRDQIPLKKVEANTPNKYFGTDGFRGEANVNLTSMQAYKVGRFLGWYYSNELSGCKKTGYRPKIVIGKDTRRSSYMLEYSLVAGITASGADAYMLHVTTTPSVSYVTNKDDFSCGIMISASHNPYYDNGIKIVNSHGEKLEDATIEKMKNSNYRVEQYNPNYFAENLCMTTVHWKYGDVAVTDFYNDAENYSHSCVDGPDGLYYNEWLNRNRYESAYDSIYFPEGYSLISDREIRFVYSYSSDSADNPCVLYTYKFDEEGNLTEILEEHCYSMTKGFVTRYVVTNTPESEIKTWVETKQAEQ